MQHVQMRAPYRNATDVLITGAGTVSVSQVQIHMCLLSQVQVRRLCCRYRNRWAHHRRRYSVCVTATGTDAHIFFWARRLACVLKDTALAVVTRYLRPSNSTANAERVAVEIEPRSSGMS